MRCDTWVLAVALLACCPASGLASTANTWSKVVLSGDVPGAVCEHGVAEWDGILYVLADVLTQIDPSTGVCTRLDASAGVTGIAPPTMSMDCEDYSDKDGGQENDGFTALNGVLYYYGRGTYDIETQTYSIGNDPNPYAYTIAERSWKKLEAANTENAITDSFGTTKNDGLGFSAGAGGLQKTYGYSAGTDAAFFDIETKTWSTLPDAPLPERQDHSQAVLGSTMYVFGGYGATGPTDGVPHYLNDLHALPMGDRGSAAQWTTVAAQGDVPAARQGGSLVAVNGQQLVMVGGRSCRAVTITVLMPYSEVSETGVGCVHAWTRTVATCADAQRLSLSLSPPQQTQRLL
jgi:hypothetical protein